VVIEMMLSLRRGALGHLSLILATPFLFTACQLPQAQARNQVLEQEHDRLLGEAKLEEAKELRQEVEKDFFSDSNPPDRWQEALFLSGAEISLNHSQVSLQWAQRAVDLVREEQGESSIAYFRCLMARGNSSAQLLDYPHAEEDLQAAYRGLQELAGPDAQETIDAYSYLGSLFQYQERWEEAIEIHRYILERDRRVLPADDLHIGFAALNLADALAAAGEDSSVEALSLYTESLRILRQQLGPFHSSTLRAAIHYATAIVDRAGPMDRMAAYQYLHRYAESLHQAIAQDDWSAIYLDYRVERLHPQDDLAAAIDRYRELIRRGQQLADPPSSLDVTLLHSLATLERIAGDEEAAKQYAEEALARLLKREPVDERWVSSLRRFLQQPDESP